MTAQVADRLLFQGQEHPLCANPLEGYFDKQHPRPPFVAPHTANWRGYVATWEVVDDTLYLVELSGSLREGEANLATIFPHHRGRVEAVWVTGDLRSPQGELLNYIHMGYASRYERDLWLVVQEGKVHLTEMIDNRTGAIVAWEPTAYARSCYEVREWSFLEQIHTEPGDSLLVYADWLEERGDPRAGVLRRALGDRVPRKGEQTWEHQRRLFAEYRRYWGWIRLLGLGRGKE